MQIFSLLPPADGWRMHLCRYPVAQYQRHGSRLEPEPVDPPQQVMCRFIKRDVVLQFAKALLKCSFRGVQSTSGLRALQA